VAKKLQGIYPEIPSGMETFQMVWKNWNSAGKSAISLKRSKVKQNIVSIEYLYTVAYDIAFGTEIDDLE